jgi:hypothetical protein
MTTEQQRLNAEKSFALASALFPQEEWIQKENNIWVAKSRLVEEYREPDKWKREISQVRILTNQGRVAYFLPEIEKKGLTGKRFADLVLDGEITEMKTVSGNRNTLGWEFKQGLKQGKAVIQDMTTIRTHSVYVRLLSDFTIESVRGKIAGELKNNPVNGWFICYFEQIGKLRIWSYEELRSIIRK